MKYQKHLLLAAAAMIAVGNVFANPILSHKYTADPQPIIWNDRVYVYASNDDKSVVESDGYVIQAYTLVSTNDMVNWTDHGEVFQVPRDWKRGNAQNARAYAPGAAVKGNTVYVYPCGAGGPIGVVSAPRPEGPFTDVLRPANGDTPPLVQASTCSNCGVPWLFDPHVFVDTDAQAYLYYGGGESSTIPNGKNMRVIKLNSDMISLPSGANATTIDAPRSFEAANMHKRGNTYYFSYVNNWSGGDGHPNAAIMYMTGTSPMGPFTLKGPVLRNPSIGNNNINRNNNNHHAAIEYPVGSDKWYMFYHDRRVADANKAPSVNQRNISVDVLTYKSNGDMNEVTVTENGAPQIKNFNPYDTIRATTMNRQSGIKTSDGGESGSTGGMKLISIGNGDWVRLKGVDFGEGATRFIVRAASANSGGSIELRIGSTSGTSIGTCAITGTGGWSTWRNFECEVNKSASAGVKDFLYLVFTGGNDMFDLSWYKFDGGSVTPQCVTDCPLIRDGKFPGTSLNSSNWFVKNTGDGVDASVSVSNGKAVVNITGVGSETYQPQLVQPGISLESGKNYTLSFKASAVSARTMGIKFEEDGTWDNYSTATFNLTTSEQSFSHVFKMPTTSSNVQFAFNFGGTSSTANITLSEVNLVEGGTTSVSHVSNNNPARQLVSVRGRMLSVLSPNNSGVMTVRVIDVMGKVRAKFDTNVKSNFLLTKIPAGRYFVDVRGAGVRQTLPVIIK